MGILKSPHGCFIESVVTARSNDGRDDGPSLYPAADRGLVHAQLLGDLISAELHFCIIIRVIRRLTTHALNSHISV